ncbi:hypothetical protein ACWGE1_29925 [Streptomyces sp. NPDC054932]
MAIGAATVARELRRGGLRRYQRWLLSLVVGLPVVILVRWPAGDGAVFTLPLWAAPLLLLPGLPYAVSCMRARRVTGRGPRRP